MYSQGSTRMTAEYKAFLQRCLGSLDADKGTVKNKPTSLAKRRVKLNGARMKSKVGAHIYISKKLKFPSYYGKNLDALNDILSTVDKPLTIIIKNTKTMYVNLREYGQAIMGVFNEAQHSNANLEIVIKD